MNEKSLIPSIRFAEYTDAWERRKLGEIADKVTEKNSSRIYSETFTNSAENGIISQRDYFDHAVSNSANLDGYYIVSEDDFVYNPRISTTAPVGPINRNRLKRRGVMSPLYTVFRTRDIDALYLEHYFKSHHWHQYMFLNGDSGARSDRFSIKDFVLMEMPIAVPCKVEQMRIGSFLEELDRLITLHQRKLEKLQNIKKSMLDKMFPKNGELFPEVRFAGFTDAWERRKLGELGKAHSGIGFPDVEQGGTEGLPFYKVSDMNISGNEHEMTKSQNYVSIEQIQRKNWTPILHVPAMFFAKVGAAVLLNRKRLCRTPFLLDNNTMAYSVCGEKWNVDFAKALFDTVNLPSLIQVGALPSYNAGDVESLEITLPNIEEQNQIGHFFRLLDHLITLHQRMLEKLKNIKKACLKKMFV